MKKNTTSLKFITVFTKTLLFTFLFSIIFVVKSLGQSTDSVASSGLWTVPAGVYSIKIEAWGGGGAGGAGSTSGAVGKFASGSGGGGGAYSRKTISVTPGQQININIGAGGLGSSTTIGGTGNSTSVSWTVSGSTYTMTANGGGAGGLGSGTTTIGAAGIGGAINTSNADAYFAGGNGSLALLNDVAFSTNSNGGAGGSSAGIAANGNNGVTSTTTTVSVSTSAPTGGGYGGASGRSAAGVIGGRPGGGGGGGKASSSTSAPTAYKGGDGAQGMVAITYTPTLPTISTPVITAGNSNVEQGGYSNVQNFTVSASNLTDNLVIRQSTTEIELSIDNATFTNTTISLTPSGGSVPVTTIYYRMKPISTGVFSGTITLSATGAPSQVLNPTCTVLNFLSPQSIPYYQDFSSLNGSSTTYPAGWQGWYISANVPSSTGRTSSASTDKALIFGDASSNVNGLYDYNGKIGILSGGTSATDFALGLAINTLNSTNVGVSFDAMTIRNTGDGGATANSTVEGLVLQYRIGSNGPFLPLSYNAEYKNNVTSQISGTAGQNIKIGLNATLPNTCDKQPVVQLRWILRTDAAVNNTTFNRPSFAIDNVSVGLSTSSNLGSTAFLPGDAISIPFNANGTYNNGNTFTAQLSDATGYFGNPTNIGSITATNSNTAISATLPNVITNGTAYRIRVISSNPVQVGSDNGSNLSILNLVNYYYKGSGDLNTNSNWGTNSDGTGTAPTNFTSDAQVFNITTNATTTNPWTVSGIGSKIVLGYPTIAPVTLTISNNNDITGPLDINASSSGSNIINVLSATAPTWGSLHSNSEVHLQSTLTTATSKTFGKLFIENGAAVTFTGTPTIQTSLTVATNATLDSYTGSGTYGKINISNNATAVINGTLISQQSAGFTCNSCNATAGTGFGATLNFADATPLIQFGPNSLVKYTRAGSAQNIQKHTYVNLEIGGGTGTKTQISTGGSTVNMTIAGNLIVGNGTILDLNNLGMTLKATSLKTASLNNQGTILNATNVTIENYIGNQRGWNILSLPFTTNTTLASLASASNIDIDFVRPTVKTFNANNTWTAAASGDSWVANSSIALFTKGISGEGINGVYSADPSNVKLVVTGTLITGTVSSTTVNANTWTLVSNPFPAPISVSAILTNSNLAGATIAWYDSKANTTNVRVKGGGYYTATPSGNAGSASDIIVPSMGTFFINSTTAGTISMTTGSIYTGTYTNTGTLATTNSVTDPGLDPDICAIDPPVLTGIDNPALLRAGGSITLTLTSPSTTGGTWTISNSNIATINGSTGVVNGILPGTVSVTYSVTNNNGCNNSVTRTIIVQDATKPVISSNSNYTFCSGNSIVLTSTEQNGNQWYKNGTAITGATSNTYTATTSGDYTVIVNFGTITKTSDPVTLIVNTTPAIPTVSNSSICVGATVNLASATASNTLNWYTVATGGTVLNTAPVSTALTAGTYNYFVSNLSADGCESARASFTVTANTVPSAPTVSNLTLCTGNTPAPLTAGITTGNTAKWFTVATGGTALSTAPTPSNTNVGTTLYYVSQISAAGCESTRSSLQVVVNSTPTLPTVTDRTLCINSTATALSASVSTGNILKWYTVATGGNALSATPVPSTTAVGTTDYFATQTTAAGCESPRVKLSVVVASTATPIVQNASLCNNVTAVALTATKTDNSYSIKWYSAATGGTALAAAPVPSTTTVGTVSYYVTQVNPANTCESQRVKIDAITNPIPVAATISKSTDQKLNASYGSTFQWYKDNVIIAGATGISYAPLSNGKYSTVVNVNGCNSPMSETYEFINTSNKQDGYTINVGPNPFTNYIQLNYNIPSVRTVSISLYSLTSTTKVFEANDVLPNAKVPINNLTPGIYIVKIISDDNRIVEKYKMIKL
jgi:hypothetical protein